MLARLITVITLFLVCLGASAANVVWCDGQHTVIYQLVGKTEPVVWMALQMYCVDMEMVTGIRPVERKKMP